MDPTMICRFGWHDAFVWMGVVGKEVTVANQVSLKSLKHILKVEFILPSYTKPAK